MTKQPVTHDPAVLEKAAVAAALQAGEVLRRHFGSATPIEVEAKGLHDFVTQVDREAEAAVVGYLHRHFPDHAIMAEEGSPNTARAGHRWIVDPLDGTTNFIHGVPVFAVSVAVEDDAGLAAGAIHAPAAGETFRASRGGGAFLNDHPIGCSPRTHLDQALLATGFPFRELTRVDRYLQAFERFIRTTAGMRRAGSAALDLAYTACGRYEGFWEVGLSPWDVAAGTLLVLEAGGIVTDITGGDRFLEGDILAAAPGIHAAMLQITKAAFS